jgi:hypothetical protein
MLDHLVSKLRARLPDRQFDVVTSPTPSIVFPASHPEVGPVEVHAENGEFTVHLPKFTHSHFPNYDKDLPQAQVVDKMADDVVEFLARLFADEIVLWGNGQGAGGWYPRNKKQCFLSRWLKRKTYVWSGPSPSAS